MGLGTPGGEKNHLEDRMQVGPIKLAPIRLPPPDCLENHEMQDRDMMPVDSRSTDKEARGNRHLRVAPVCFKKSSGPSKSNLPATFGVGGAFTPIIVGVVQTTTSTTVTPAVRSPPSVPLATFAKSTTTTTTTHHRTLSNAAFSALLNNEQVSTTTLQTAAPISMVPSPSVLGTTKVKRSRKAIKSEGNSNNRRRVTPEQLAVLEREFECGMIPDLETRQRLASRLGFSERRVQVWFQNRRAKMKKDNHDTPIFIINTGISSFKNN